jgi:hypothetical protein
VLATAAALVAEAGPSRGLSLTWPELVRLVDGHQRRAVDQHLVRGAARY